MFDISKKLSKFYTEHVRLGRERRNELGKFRDNNLELIKSGLDVLGEEDGREYAHFIDWQDQGSYAMHTLNQQAGNEYDIDVALIFDADDLPNDPAQARIRVCRALRKKDGRYKDQPQARDNAVTVWYADGQHVDFAIYRRRTDWLGLEEMIEHAGGNNWIPRDPQEVTKWFTDTVNRKSPSDTFLLDDVKVEPKQMRRIVRFLKRFARSRVTWDLPGGMIISTLVAECYVADRDRDDVSLYQTMAAMRRRLDSSLTVYSPVRSDQELTDKDSHKIQVENLRDKLAVAIDKLTVLFKSTCTEADACNAWNYVFNHDFWKNQESKAENLLRPASASAGLVFPNKPSGPVKPNGFA